MVKKKNKKNVKFTSKRFFILAISLILIIFLALPLIFKDSSEMELQKSGKQTTALPLGSENPFTHYLKLLKDFYTPNKNSSQQKQFTKTNNALLAKNKEDIYQEELPPTLSPQATPTASLNKEESASATNNYYAEEAAENPFYNLMQEPQDPFVEQKPFDNIIIEGLYETSHTDPYEVKQAARRTLFDIFSPKRRLALLSPRVSGSALFTGNNIQETPQTNTSTNAIRTTDIQTRTFNTDTSYLSSGIDGSNYNYGSLESFHTNQIYSNLDLSGLSFEDQANIVTARLNNIIQRDNYARRRDSNNNGQTDQNNGNNNKPPRPPLPQKDSFDPTKWNQTATDSCNSERHNQAVAMEEESEQSSQGTTSHPIIPCAVDSDKMDRVEDKMQAEHKYLIVSGRQKGKIMIPSYSSLAEDVLTRIPSKSNPFKTLNTPKEIRKKGATEKTDYKFVNALKPEVFRQVMRDEKTILLSVDPIDLILYPANTILIRSGEIETYEGVNKIIAEINNFSTKQAEIKKFLKEKEEMEKQQKLEEISQKIESNM
jgi:hypothetical protein